MVPSLVRSVVVVVGRGVVVGIADDVVVLVMVVVPITLGKLFRSVVA